MRFLDCIKFRNQKLLLPSLSLSLSLSLSFPLMAHLNACHGVCIFNYLFLILTTFSARVRHCHYLLCRLRRGSSCWSCNTTSERQAQYRYFFHRYAIPGIFFFIFRLFNTVDRNYNCRWLDSNRGSMYQKRPLFQLRHNHCPKLMLEFHYLV